MFGRSILYGITVLLLLTVAGVIIFMQMQKSPQNDKIATVGNNVVTTTETAITDTAINLTRNLMQLTSTAFGNNQNIPSKYTCDADDINPPLEISGIPEETVSLALIVDDPDAPAGDWVHWVLFNIPPSTTSIGEDSAPGGTEGTTDFGKTGWGGPCPPSGTHRYYFKLFALDTELDLDSTATKAELETAMTGHVLDRTELVGLYQRS